MHVTEINTLAILRFVFVENSIAFVIARFTNQPGEDTCGITWISNA